MIILLWFFLLAIAIGFLFVAYKIHHKLEKSSFNRRNAAGLEGFEDYENMRSVLFKEKILKFIGGTVIIVGLILGFGSLQGIYNYFSIPENNTSTQRKPTMQEILNEIQNDTKTKVYLPKGVRRSSLIPSEEESTKLRCESCATNLKPGSRVANNQNIISNCAPMKQKCNKIGIAW